VQKSSKPLQQQIKDAKLRVMELEDAYITQLYLETMPDEFDYKYGYHFSDSNHSVPGILHNPDNWLKAIVKHMWTRKPNRGGARTLAEVITVPDGLTEKQIDVWLAYVTDKLKKKALLHMKRVKKTK